MNPAKVRREAVRVLTDLPNVGPSIAGDLRLLGIEQPQQLLGRNAWDMYAELCLITRQQHDPCVIDVFLSLTDFIDGGEPKLWWHYTAQRKAVSATQVAGPGTDATRAVPSRRTSRHRRD
ncbi:MAG: mitomycin resistance protein [Thermomonas sp.]|uniref:helix-hairpin-helix domain-containing protein n=1 Tax=Thermomonas sp. TaxID=1971895 RepID=UPI00261182AA|nr:helix-hairpin-helix domain-containing protein [Thermomonas sp.]MCC7097720.1 mitomycin resistance protein [Thermomonas sp.]